ncbi:MAG TPA: hypothetical protein VFI68_01925 [Anaerolineales bacterium]|nr:hypothetical protein [Anaerolineales bacterium]
MFFQELLASLHPQGRGSDGGTPPNKARTGRWGLPPEGTACGGLPTGRFAIPLGFASGTMSQTVGGKAEPMLVVSL